MKYYIGIDIGGMSIKAGIVDEDGNIISKSTCVTRVLDGKEAIALDMYNLCKEVTAIANLEQKDILGVGIGCPGTVNSQKGVITFAANLNFKKVNIVKEFNKHWNVKTVVNNDANCAALGETKFGSGKEYSSSLFVTLGTGVGTGFIIDNKIFEGENGEGAEGGHVCIRMDGEKCSCGQKGCWEAYASATALIKQTKKAMQKHPESLMNEIATRKGEVNGTVAFEAYKAGDKVAEKVVKKYAEYVATGLVVFINVFRPQVVMIGGGVSNAGEYFIEMIRKQVKKKVFAGKINRIPNVVKANLGNDAGIVGAAAPVMD